jgi:hypothetical protein
MSKMQRMTQRAPIYYEHLLHALHLNPFSTYRPSGPSLLSMPKRTSQASTTIGNLGGHVKKKQKLGQDVRR